MDTTGLIDAQNADLWNLLLTDQEIDIDRGYHTEYRVYTKGKRATIYVPVNDINSSSFTHELLHIFLRTKGVFIGANLTHSLKSNQLLNAIFSDELINHMTNCIDHIKMLPLFLDMGYNPNDFIMDSSINKLSHAKLAAIKKGLKRRHWFNTVYQRAFIDLYIGSFFAAVACPDKAFNYSDGLKVLKSIDPLLYKVLDDFVNDWIAFDYQSDDILKNSYILIAFNFVQNLEQWAAGKTLE